MTGRQLLIEFCACYITENNQAHCVPTVLDAIAVAWKMSYPGTPIRLYIENLDERGVASPAMARFYRDVFKALKESEVQP